MIYVKEGHSLHVRFVEAAWKTAFGADSLGFPIKREKKINLYRKVSPESNSTKFSLSSPTRPA